jgi:hypothetical protein
MAYSHIDQYRNWVLNPFLHSIGILADVGVLQIHPEHTGTGDFVQMPRLNDISSFVRRDISTTGQTRSFTNMGSVLEKGVILHDDAADAYPIGEQAFTGAPFMMAWHNRVGVHFARRVKQNMYRVAKAAVEACDTTDGTTASADIHISDVYSSTTAALMTVARLQTAMSKMGDAAGQLSVAVMHSVCWNNFITDLTANYKIDTVAGYIINRGGITDVNLQLEIQKSMLGRIAFCEALGLIILVDDDISSISMTGSTYTYKTKYETLLLGPGALSFQFQRELILAQDTDIKDARGTTQLLRAEADYMVHLNGVKWNSATANPTDVQLGTKSNWDEVYTDHKEVKCVKLITNG